VPTTLTARQFSLTYAVITLASSQMERAMGGGHSHAERVVRLYSNLAEHPMGIVSSGDLAVPASDTSQAG
jgi:hypothetical protein